MRLTWTVLTAVLLAAAGSVGRVMDAEEEMEEEEGQWDDAAWGEAAFEGAEWEEEEGEAEAEDVSFAVGGEMVTLPKLNARVHVEEFLAEEETATQLVRLGKSAYFGKLLLLDNELALASIDEFKYHEMLVLPPMAYVQDPRRVLLLGGGDGGAALQVLQHPQVETVTLVEVDEAVVRIAKEHLPYTAQALRSARLETVIAEGSRHVGEMCARMDAGSLADADKYDVVIVDGSEAGPGEPLYDTAFYANVRRCAMRAGAVFARNIKAGSWGLPKARRRVDALKGVWDHMRVYNVFLPSYPSGHYLMAIASDAGDPLRMRIHDHVGKHGLVAKYYNRDAHWASFVLPAFTRHGLGLERASLEADTMLTFA